MKGLWNTPPIVDQANLAATGGTGVFQSVGFAQTAGGAADALQNWDAANIIGQRNGTNAQGYRVYTTFTDTSNYGRLVVDGSAGNAIFATESAGTGGAIQMFVYNRTNSSISFGTNNASRWVMSSTGLLTAVSATAVLGYGTGSGGAQTQATSKATGVTLSTPNGQITLNNASLAASTAVAFTLTNTLIAATDLVVLNHVSAGTAGAYSFCSTPAAGSAVITVRNLTAGALAEAIVVQFAVIKGSVS